MKKIWSVLCEKATLDKDSNNLSLINVIEQLTIASSPEELTKASSSDDGIVIPFNLFFVTLWTKEDDEIGEELDLKTKINIVDPEGKEIGSFESNSVVKKEHKRMRTRLKLNGFKITVPGTYTINVLKKEGKDYKEVDSLPLDVNFSSNSSN